MNNNLYGQVIEDNGGGLHLYVFDEQGHMVYAHSGYEYEDDHLMDDIEQLLLSDSVDGWWGCDDNPQEGYDSLTQNEFGYEVVADIENGKCVLYINRMGTAAIIAFDVKDNS